MKDLKHSFREYFPIPDASKNWIRDPFSVNVNKQEGFTAAEEDKLIEISTDGELKLQFKEQSVPNFWAPLKEYYLELPKRV